MNRPTRSFIVIALLVCAALLISACTREATTDALPTSPPDGVGGGGEPAQQATNAAAMEQLLAQGQTQTAQASIGLNTAVPGAITPTPLVAQQTPAPAATAIPAATAVPAAGLRCRTRCNRVSGCTALPANLISLRKR